MKFFLYILLLASVSLITVPSTSAISSTGSANEINPKVRAYEQASSSGDPVSNEATKSSEMLFQPKTLKKLTDRLHASVFRIESIQSRLTSRIAKMQKSGVKVTKINTKLTALVKQFNLLKKEMETIDKLTESFLISADKKNDYEALRSEVLVLRGLLNDSLVSEKTILADMKVLDPSGITPTISKTAVKK